MEKKLGIIMDAKKKKKEGEAGRKKNLQEILIDMKDR